MVALNLRADGSISPEYTNVKMEIERRVNESNQSYVNCQGAPATEK